MNIAELDGRFFCSSFDGSSLAVVIWNTPGMSIAEILTVVLPLFPRWIFFGEVIGELTPANNSLQGLTFAFSVVPSMVHLLSLLFRWIVFGEVIG